MMHDMDFENISGASVNARFNPDGTTEIACEGFAIGLLLIALHLIEHVVDNGPNRFSDAIALISYFHEESEAHRKESRHEQKN